MSMLVALGLIPALQGCSDRIAGSTTETENVVTAVDFSVDSLLADQGPMRHAPTVATLRLDSSLVDFQATDSLGLDLIVERMDSVPLPFSIVYWNRPASLGRIHVRLDSLQRTAGSRIRLRWKAPLRVRSNPTSVWRGLPASQVLALNSFLVDDFERNNLRSLLPDSASWYSVSTDSATVSLPKLDTAGLGRPGRSIHIAYHADSATYQYALLGIGLGRTSVNLQSLDSMVLWVRGSGKLSIAMDHLTPGNQGKAWLHRSLAMDWTRVHIRPQDFNSPSIVGNNVGWEAVRNRVTNLTFLVAGGSELWLDDIRLYGIDGNDLKQ